MKISKSYQKALEICESNREFQILEYIKGKSPKIKLKCLCCGNIFERYLCHFIQYPRVCPKCHPKGSNQKVGLVEAQRRIDEVYGDEYLKILTYDGNNILSQIQCLKCGYIFNAVPSSLWRERLRGCPICEKTQSLGENKLQKFFRENNIQYRRQERFQECRDKSTLPFDFYLPQYNICIEFQGEQHYNKNSIFWSETLIKHDEIKRTFCENNNIKLIEIPYYDLNDFEKYFTFIRK